MTILENTILCTYEGCSGVFNTVRLPPQSWQLLNAEYIIDTMLILVLFSLDLLQITSLFAGVKIGLSLKYFTYELMRFVAPEGC